MAKAVQRLAILAGLISSGEKRAVSLTGILDLANGRDDSAWQSFPGLLSRDEKPAVSLTGILDSADGTSRSLYQFFSKSITFSGMTNL
jgi:hypothetical protein